VPFRRLQVLRLGGEGLHAIDEYWRRRQSVELTGGTRDPFTLG